MHVIYMIQKYWVDASTLSKEVDLHVCGRRPPPSRPDYTPTHKCTWARECSRACSRKKSSLCISMWNYRIFSFLPKQISIYPRKFPMTTNDVIVRPKFTDDLCLVVLYFSFYFNVPVFFFVIYHYKNRLSSLHIFVHLCTFSASLHVKTRLRVLCEVVLTWSLR